MSEQEVYARVRSYEVSVWPDSCHDNIDAVTWCCSAGYRGHGKWAVIRGGDGSMRDSQNPAVCLSAAGTWEFERIPSERSDDWLALHRFTLADAMELAAEHAPEITINGLTAVEALARHRARNLECCRG